MTAHDTEQGCVLCFLQQLLIVGNLHALVSAEPQLSTHLLIYADVQFRYVNVVHNLSIFANGSLHFFFRRAIDVVVSLHTYTVDGYTGSLHVLDHLVDAVALHGVTFVIVVIEQQRLGVSFACKLKSLANKLVVAANLVEGTLAQRLVLCIRSSAAISNTLVEDIPAVHHILITVHHCMDMFAHTLVKNLFCYQIVFLVIEHPVAHLVMPHQGVST